MNKDYNRNQLFQIDEQMDYRKRQTVDLSNLNERVFQSGEYYNDYSKNEFMGEYENDRTMNEQVHPFENDRTMNESMLVKPTVINGSNH